MNFWKIEFQKNFEFSWYNVLVYFYIINKISSTYEVQSNEPKSYEKFSWSHFKCTSRYSQAEMLIPNLNILYAKMLHSVYMNHTRSDFYTYNPERDAEILSSELRISFKSETSAYNEIFLSATPNNTIQS